MTPLIAVLTTVGSEADARRMARALVEQRLAACVQISRIDSVYRWEGAVQEEPEWRLLVKAPASRWDELHRAVRALHPYELPALFALPVSQADEAYVQWVEDQSGA